MSAGEVAAQVEADLQGSGAPKWVRAGIAQLMVTPLEELGCAGPGAWLLNECATFLLWQATNRDADVVFPKSIPSGPHPNKYIVLHSWIYSNLGLPRDSGYDYWLMCYLDTYEIMEHGSGIRCGWWNGEPGNPYHGRVVPPTADERISEWASAAPDDV